MQTDPMQEIFDRAEELADAIATASGCTGALSLLLDQIRAEMPELLAQASAVANAIDMYLSVAGRHADGIARLTFDQVVGLYDDIHETFETCVHRHGRQHPDDGGETED